MKNTKNTQQFQSTAPESKFFVIGIGASAGGLKALEDFFENMPADNGASFIVIQHLSPDFKSLMKELLERRTRMAVYRVTDGMKLQPNSIYLIPPRNNLILENRHLRLIEQVDEGRHRFNFPINLCFQSLAADCGDRAIGVILSGTGSDGTQGLQAISEAGGITLVQSPTTAEFDGMPQSAIATGLVDRVLSPRDLAQTLYEIVRLSSHRANSSESVAAEIDRVKLKQIVGILTDEENIDFSYYKISTMSRRIYRRCSMTGFDAIEDYIAYLQESSEERKLLQEDLLIGVTSFFRDPKAWEYLEKQIFPELIEQTKPSDQIRVWVTACATGEEAYSMAILLDEAIQKSGKSVNLKIFATDIDTAALEKASKGVYSENIVNEISSERLERYFTFKDGSFYVNPKLREMLIFAPHHLAKNAGFSKMNLISCRNVLIYMQPQLQRRVMRMLHFSLIPKGILFLGAAETLGDLEDEFEPLDEKWKLFRKRRDVRLPFFSSGTTPINRTASPSLKLNSAQPRLDPLLSRAFASFLCERRATCFLVNRDNELLHVFSDAAGLLQVPQGWMTKEIAQMMPQALQLPLTTALHRAKRENKPVLYAGIVIGEGDKVRSLNLRVTYQEAEAMATDFLMVVIEDDAKPHIPPTPEVFQVDTKATQRILELEYELQQTTENLQATIEELETTNEEQQATNEELLASNEELQSTNEELHSVNEELYTVNAEYQSKIQELTELNNDLNNLLRGTDIGVIFLDESLKIRKFTPAATVAINLVDADINRPIEHLSHNMDYFDLVGQLREAIATRQASEKEVKIVKTGSNFLMRVHPYQNETLEYEGLVVTFIKIDKLKQTQAKLERQTAELEYLYQNMPVGLALIDEEFRYIKANERLSQINGVPVEKIIGATVSQVVPELKDKVEPILCHVLNTGESVENLEVSGVTAAAPNVQRDWIANYHPVELPGDRRIISVVVNEITELKQAQKALQASQERLKLTLLATGIGTWWWEPEPDRATWDDRIHRLYGISPEQMPLTYPDWLKLIHPEDREMVEQRVIAALEDRQSYEVEFRIVWPDGSIRWLAARGKVERDAQKRPIRMLSSNIDITERRQAQADLQLSEERLHHLIDLLPHQIFATNAEGRFILANQATVDS
ncbi:MAG: chemotaxis protein CheB [Prochloraceae cyanobacterium]|nr:chemotaxis protein CheB [Prochloraceae cyanobacterium]